MIKTKTAPGRTLQFSIVAIALATSSAFQSASAQDASAQSVEAARTVNAPPAGSVGGAGDINLYPKRIVLNGRRAITPIGLFNRGTGDGNYQITIKDMAMTPDGRLVEFDNGLSEAVRSRVKTASPFLRYSPRRVTLRAGQSQTIRVMARGGSDLPDGEYRSHFTVVAIPDDVSEGFSIQQATNQTSQSGIGVTIRPRFGISIPVIVRIGETTLDVGISSAQLLTAQDGTQAISFTLNRTGTRSAFGDIMITASASDIPVAVAKGVGLYPEIDSRQMLIPINPEATNGTPLGRGSNITITYVDDDFEPGAILAEQSIVLP